MPEDSSSNGRIWQGLKALLFGEREASLRDQIEDAIDELTALLEAIDVLPTARPIAHALLVTLPCQGETSSRLQKMSASKRSSGLLPKQAIAACRSIARASIPSQA